MRANPRRRAREFALQGLYQRQLSGNAIPAIRAQLGEAGGFALADHAYFDEWWAGVTAQESALIESITPCAVSAGPLVVYCTHDPDACELAAQTFTRESGIVVAMTRKATGEVYAQLRAERDNPKADVWYGGTFDSFVQGAAEGLFAPY